MENKKKSSKGGKRSAPQSEEDFLWECSICTQKKNQGAHGESSSSSQPHDEPGTSSGSQKKKNNYPKQRKPRTPKIKSQLENIDPSSATVYDITVDGVAVQITEYKQKKPDVDNSREGSSSRDAKEPLNTSKNTSNADKNPSDDDSD